MSFKTQFHNIVTNLEVKNECDRLLQIGRKDDFFIDYFGVNFNKEQIVSVKFYFSFSNFLPENEILKEFGANEILIHKIKTNWRPNKSFKFLHQGITLGLKCYLKDNQIRINKYIHVRIPETVSQLPTDISLEIDELKNYPGFCSEKHESDDELKYYYYITSKNTIHKIYDDFQLNNYQVNLNHLHLVEYTESDKEKKVNLIIDSSEQVKNILESFQSPEILELSKYLFTKYKLYYYGPGIRFGSDIRAIYFLPKELYYELKQVNTVKNILETEINDNGH